MTFEEAELSKLIKSGLTDTNSYQWKLLIMLLNLVNDCNRIKKRMGQIMELLSADLEKFLREGSNFQQHFYLILTLSRCEIDYKNFQSVKKDSSVFELLYGVNKIQNDSISIIGFILDHYCHKFETCFKIDSVSLGYASNKQFNCEFNPLKYNNSQFFLLQPVYDKLHLFGEACTCLELDRETLKINKSLRNDIRMSVKATNIQSNNIRLFNGSLELSTIIPRVSWLKLSFIDTAIFNDVFHRITYIPKVFESTTFLALNYMDIINNQENDTDDSAFSLSEMLKTSSKVTQTVTHHTNTNTKEVTQLATPDKSDSAVSVDAWELNPTTGTRGNDDNENPVINELSKIITKANPTTENVAESSIAEVTAKRSKRPNLESGNDPMASLVITKCETLPKSKVRSIGAKDLSVLNTIFGDNKTKGKFLQKQLKNVKPVITIASQEPIVKSTRTMPIKDAVVSNTASKSPTKRVTRSGGKVHKPICPRDPKVAIVPKAPTGKLEGKKKNVTIKDKKHNTRKRPEVLETAQLSPKRQHVKEFSVPPVTEAQDNTTAAEEESTKLCIPDTAISLADQLQQQIANSISTFSLNLTRKLEIINEEVNNKIITELSQKYNKLVNELRKTFQNDTEEIISFVNDIQSMLNVPEDQLIRLIRAKSFGDDSTKS